MQVRSPDTQAAGLLLEGNESGSAPAQSRHTTLKLLPRNSGSSLFLHVLGPRQTSMRLLTDS